MGKDRRDKGFRIPDDALKMAKTSLKKFKKKNDDYYDGKKEMKKAYYEELVDLLPDTIALLVRYGHVKEVQEIKDQLYEKLVDPQFVKVLKHLIEDKVDVKNIKMLPIVIRDIVHMAKQQEAKDKETDVNAEGYDVEDLIELSKLILKKKIKKMKNEGIDEDVAFQCLSVIPCDKVLEDKQVNYRLRVLMNVLYELAKTKEIEFGKVIGMLIPEKYASVVILFCLLERKDKFASFNENQQKFFIQINGWIFDVLEDMERNQVESILNTYVDTRKRDESNGRDGNRRYFLKSLPETDYPRVRKVIDRMLESDSSVEKYF